VSCASAVIADIPYRHMRELKALELGEWPCDAVDSGGGAMNGIRGLAAFTDGSVHLPPPASSAHVGVLARLARGGGDGGAGGGTNGGGTTGGGVGMTRASQVSSVESGILGVAGNTLTGPMDEG